jgi:delta 1-pyrroline-5-carboxylate dehydrogenase
MAAILAGTGCGSGDSDGKNAHLMKTESAKAMRGIIHTQKKDFAKNTELLMKEMEIRHQEKMAAIKAEKEKAIKKLDLEEKRNEDDTRRIIKELESRETVLLEKERQKYAALVAEKEKSLKTMDLQNARHRNQTIEAISRIEAENRLALEKERKKYDKTISVLDKKLRERYAIILAILGVLLMVFLYFLYRHYRKSRLSELREKQRHEAYLLESRQYHERINRILDMISENRDQAELKLELARMLNRKNAINPPDFPEIPADQNIPPSQSQT